MHLPTQAIVLAIALVTLPASADSPWKELQGLANAKPSTEQEAAKIIAQRLKAAQAGLTTEGTDFHLVDNEILIHPDSHSQLGKLATSLEEEASKVAKPELYYSPDLTLSGIHGMFLSGGDTGKIQVKFGESALIGSDLMGRATREHEIGVHFKNHLSLLAGRYNPYAGSIHYVGDEASGDLVEYPTYSFDESAGARVSFEILKSGPGFAKQVEQVWKLGGRLNYRARILIEQSIKKDKPAFVVKTLSNGRSQVYAVWKVINDVPKRDGSTVPLPFEIRLPLPSSKGPNDFKNKGLAHAQRKALLAAITADDAIFDAWDGN